jgi:hypothetical protein
MGSVVAGIGADESPMVVEFQRGSVWLVLVCHTTTGAVPVGTREGSEGMLLSQFRKHSLHRKTVRGSGGLGQALRSDWRRFEET